MNGSIPRASFRSLLGSCLISLVLGVGAVAQTWQTVEDMYGGPIVYDQARQRCVNISMNGTAFRVWEWDGLGWLPTEATLGMPGMSWYFPQLVYDASRHLTVLLYLTRTWTYDGLSWRLVDSQSPADSGDMQTAYDPVRQVVVHYVHGARTTYEWAGSSWRAVAAGVGAVGGSFSGGIAFDPVRQQVVAFNKMAPAAIYAYDGVAWTQIPGTMPANFPSQGGVLVTDTLRNQVLLYGGWLGSAPIGQVQAWNGSAWNTVATGPAQTWPGMAPDGSGHLITMLTGQTWLFDGASTFTKILSRPQAAFDQLVLDPVRHVLVGTAIPTAQAQPTWEWDGHHWSDPGMAPAGSYAFGLVFDGTTNSMLGLEQTATLTYLRTWQWTGTSWQLLQPANSPEFTPTPSATYDPLHHVVVLYGLHGTFLWDGTDWSHPSTIHSPPQGRTAIFDPASQRVIHIGSNLGAYSEWRWDGVDWTASALTVPQATGKLVADPRTGRILYVTATGTWQRTSSAYVQLTGGASVPNAVEADPATGLLRSWNAGWSIFGGNAALTASLGTGCGNPAPALVAVGRPAPFTNHTLLDIGHVAPNAFVALYADVSTTSLPLGSCTQYLPQPVHSGSTLANAIGFASFPFQIPSATFLFGLDVYLQGVAVDLGGPLFGVAALTNAVRLHVGE